MAIQTDVKQEKDFFDTIISKIKKSKTIGFDKVKNPEKNKKNTFYVLGGLSDIYRFKFDTFTLDLVYGKNDLDNSNYTLDTDKCVYLLSIYDKSCKKIATIDCSPHDVEGDALKLQILRNTMGGEIVDTIEKRVQKEKEKEEKQKQKKAELKKAAERVKMSEKLRAQQQKESIELAQALKKIKHL